MDKEYLERETIRASMGDPGDAADMWPHKKKPFPLNTATTLIRNFPVVVYYVVEYVSNAKSSGQADFQPKP